MLAARIVVLFSVRVEKTQVSENSLMVNALLTQLYVLDPLYHIRKRSELHGIHNPLLEMCCHLLGLSIHAPDCSCYWAVLTSHSFFPTLLRSSVAIMVHACQCYSNVAHCYDDVVSHVDVPTERYRWFLEKFCCVTRSWSYHLLLLGFIHKGSRPYFGK